MNVRLKATHVTECGNSNRRNLILVDRSRPGTIHSPSFFMYYHSYSRLLSLRELRVPNCRKQEESEKMIM